MKNLNQMELIKSTSSQGDIPANHSARQDVKKVSKIRDTSGQSILDLSNNSDQLGLLERMLVDTLNSVSTPYSRTWKVRVTPQGRLVFQLLASVPTTKEKESGFWPTPNARDWKDSVNKVPPSVGKTRGHSLGMKVAERKMWPTPIAAIGMNMRLTENMAKLRHKKYLETEVAYQESAPGGKLNPTGVEWLMGYPTQWTDLNP